jgi:hypothetical protein
VLGTRALIASIRPLEAHLPPMLASTQGARLAQ